MVIENGLKSTILFQAELVVVKDERPRQPKDKSLNKRLLHVPENM
jgi:hypothetical protein